MITTSKTTVVIQLTLNEAEAKWLKALMQNPFSEGPLDEEEFMREELFKGLAAALGDKI